MAAARAAPGRWRAGPGRVVSTDQSLRMDRPSGRWAPAIGTQPMPRFKVVAYDFGVKHNILRMLADRGCRVTVVPAHTPAAEVLAQRPTACSCPTAPATPSPATTPSPPRANSSTAASPTFGICLGHQIMGLACGARTYKMKFGHHGANHPVKDLDDRPRVHHQPEPRLRGRSPTDLAGQRARHARVAVRRHAAGPGSSDRPAFCFQGHPEACPGPHDIGYLFDRFIVTDGRGEREAHAIARTAAHPFAGCTVFQRPSTAQSGRPSKKITGRHA
jgi:carbamoyl-phosphate synthase small subunit